MATLNVGPGQPYSTIASAVAAASSGDTIDVQAGTYTNDFPVIGQSLTLQAVGGTVSMVATQDPPNGKGIIDEGGPGVNVTIQGFDISGAQVPDENGAGVRYEGGNLTLNNDTIHNNQDGLLSNPDPSGSITISNSNFYGNGTGSGNTHDVYVGDVGNLTVQNSTITDTNVGHEIKSRAENNTITSNTIGDDSNGTSSYEIDLPNGGNAYIQGNTIEKGANAQNPTAISFGEEGNVHSSSSLTVTGNTMVNHYTAHYTTGVANDSGVTASVTGNQVSGWNTMVSGLANVSDNATLTSAADTATTSAPAADTATVPINATTLGSSGNTASFTASVADSSATPAASTPVSQATASTGTDQLAGALSQAQATPPSLGASSASLDQANSTGSAPASTLLLGQDNHVGATTYISSSLGS